MTNKTEEYEEYQVPVKVGMSSDLSQRVVSSFLANTTVTGSPEQSIADIVYALGVILYIAGINDKVIPEILKESQDHILKEGPEVMEMLLNKLKDDLSSHGTVH